MTLPALNNRRKILIWISATIKAQGKYNSVRTTIVLRNEFITALNNHQWMITIEKGKSVLSSVQLLRIVRPVSPLKASTGKKLMAVIKSEVRMGGP